MKRLLLCVLLLFAASPRAASAQETSTIFFGYQESSLSGEAQAILTDAARAFHVRKYSREIVTGYCDAAEMMKDCAGLAQRRADAVKTALVRLGIDPNAVETRVSTDLLVPTGANQRETRNRCAKLDPQP